MIKFAFISRHQPTPGQVDLASKKGIFLESVGDADAFTVTPEWVADHGDYQGVVVVHPAAALRLAHVYDIGVFRNMNRADPGQPVSFEAAELVIWPRFPDVNSDW